MGSQVGRGGGGYLAGVRAGLPFALVVGVVAFSFGVVAPIEFSVAAFSVTAQFAVAAVALRTPVLLTALAWLFLG
jgi:hypothetical protein